LSNSLNPITQSKEEEEEEEEICLRAAKLFHTSHTEGQENKQCGALTAQFG